MKITRVRVRVFGEEKLVELKKSGKSWDHPWKKKEIDLNSQLNRLVSDVSQVLGFLGVFLENKFWDFENVFWFVSLTAMVFLAQFLGWNSYRKISHWWRLSRVQSHGFQRQNRHLPRITHTQRIQLCLCPQAKRRIFTTELPNLNLKYTHRKTDLGTYL